MQKLIRVKGMKIQNPINEPMAMEKAVLVQKFGEVVSSESQSPKAPAIQYISNVKVPYVFQCILPNTLIDPQMAKPKYVKSNKGCNTLVN